MKMVRQMELVEHGYVFRWIVPKREAYTKAENFIQKRETLCFERQ